VYYLGEPPTPPAEPKPVPPQAYVQEWQKHNDCICRGGVWNPGSTEGFGVCIPGAEPTGKYFDPAQKGCFPLPGATKIIPVDESKLRPLYGGDWSWLWWALGIGAVVILAPVAVSSFRRYRRRRKGVPSV